MYMYIFIYMKQLAIGARVLALFPSPPQRTKPNGCVLRALCEERAIRQTTLGTCQGRERNGACHAREMQHAPPQERQLADRRIPGYGGTESLTVSTQAATQIGLNDGRKRNLHRNPRGASNCAGRGREKRRQTKGHGMDLSYRQVWQTAASPDHRAWAARLNTCAALRRRGSISSEIGVAAGPPSHWEIRADASTESPGSG